MKEIVLNPGVDLQIDVTDLTSEMKRLSLLLFRYYEKKAELEREFDLAKFRVDEIKGQKYKEFKNGPIKISDAGVSAQIDSDPDVILALKDLSEARRQYSTWIGAVESMKAKKDLIIQLAADRRKEV